MSYQPEPIPADLTPAYVARELRRVADALGLARRAQYPVINVKSYGAKGDGKTNDYSAFTRAVAASENGRVYVPAGTYRLEFSAMHALNLPQGVSIEGEGKERTTLVFAPTDNAFHSLFRSGSGDVAIRGLTVEADVPEGGQVAAFNVSASRFTLEGVKVDGGVTHNESGVSHLAYGINLGSSGAQDDIFVEGCDFARVHFSLLKTNTATSAQRRIRFVNCDFSGNYREDLTFNSPNGVMDDVQVIGCRFFAGHGVDAGLHHIHCAFASITNFSVTNCHFEGPVSTAIHLEEDCFNGVIASNTFEIDQDATKVGACIELIENDNGSSVVKVPPERIVIAGNTMKKAGVQKGPSSYGVFLVNDATPDMPARHVVISGNVIEGFLYGISVHAENDAAVAVRDNVVLNCAWGIRSLGGTGSDGGAASIAGNVTKDCDVDIRSNGGLISGHRFVNPAVPVVSEGMPTTLVDPEWSWKGFAIEENASVSRTLLDLGSGDRVFGDMTVHAVSETGQRHSLRVASVEWHGSSFDVTSHVALQPSSLESVIEHDSGALMIRVFSGEARNNVRLVAKLQGTVFVAVLEA